MTMLGMDNNDNIPIFITVTMLGLLPCDGLTPFQASVVFQESSAICLWQHSAGNWINLPQLKYTNHISRQIGT